MFFTSKKRKDYIKSILDNIPKESFKIEKILGNGYFDGVVIVKNNKLAGRIESIKFLESVEPNLRSQFLREGKTLSAMQHKNIPRLYDIIEHDDLLLFRYEHIEGHTLMDVLEFMKRHNKTFPRHTATSIILKLMNALYYAHNEVRYENKRRSIIHCDIKPSNILLCSKDYKMKDKVDSEFIELVLQNKVEPYIIDFGIARFRGNMPNAGTPHYMSPAQIKGKHLDWRTDIYQLLLVYSEILTNKTPYDSMPRSRIFSEKSKIDFKMERNSVPWQIKDFIEKGTTREVSRSFKSEKECIKDLSKIEKYEKRFEFIRRYRKPILVVSILAAALLIFFIAYTIWDAETQSVDAIIRNIEKNPNPSIEELQSAASRIQIRAFEEKYYEPLMNGEFRDTSTGKPMYPSHLDANGKWILVGPETESAGIFVGLLFNYSDRYPELLDYAKEYAEPILNSDFDGSGEKRFTYALIPAYEHTHDERYLKRLINITDTLIDYYLAGSGTTQCNDMYTVELSLYVYNKTGDKKYLEFSENVSKSFALDNLDNDGYIYSVSTLTESVDLNGSFVYDRWSPLVTNFDGHQIGLYYNLKNISESKFKSMTSPYSKDFIQVMITLHDINEYSPNQVYVGASDSVSKYYTTLSPSDGIDYMFVSGINEKNDIPKDTLTAVKSLYFFEDNNKIIYYNKLHNLLSSKYFLKENEKAILSGSVLIENMRYDNTDKNLRNQSIIDTDALFLELKMN